MERIFVSMASLGDAECQWTVQDMFAKAKYPKRISVGICWLGDKAKDHLNSVKTLSRDYAKQIHSVHFPLNQLEGAAWARLQTYTLWKKEEYILQIHAHSRFEQDWDELLIETLKRCPSEKPVLSTMLPAYTPPGTIPYRDEMRAGFITVNSVVPNDDPQIMHLRGMLANQQTPLPLPMRSPFWVESFLFARSSLLKEVPFDPFIYFYGEEIGYSARLWTHGYDVFQPNLLAVYHSWDNDALLHGIYRNAGQTKHALGYQRVKHLLRLHASPTSEAIRDLDAYGLGNARSLEEFWAFAGIDPKTGTVAAHAQQGTWEEAYTSHLARKNILVPDRPRIFVQIASYRDPECQWTVKDLFDKAKYPDRISVGICWQFDPKKDKDCFEISTRPDQVRMAKYHWKDSQGVCWARSETQKLWRGEEYTLAIDSHMRFVFDWDERLIQQLAECDSPKAILTSYPASYTPPHDLEVGAMPTIQRAHPYSDEGDVRFRGDFLSRSPEKPLRGAFIAAGFMFSKSEVIRDIPYDPYLYFNQEELSMAARFFTHGWDVYSVKDVLIYHFYGDRPESKKRPLHWEDNKDWSALQLRARKRFDHLLGYEITEDADVLQELYLYGLGSVRSLEDYSRFSGIDFKNRVVNERGLRAQFIPDLHKYKDEPIHIPEIDAGTPPSASLLSFPHPEKAQHMRFDQMLLANGQIRQIEVDTSAPEGVLIMPNYLDRELCDVFARYADSELYTDLDVLNPLKSTADKIVTERDSGRVTQHVEIDGMAAEILDIFNDVYCRRLAPFYNVNFEWYERPQILRYPVGGKYNFHADADHWDPKTNTWSRVQDRDYSVLVYLNDKYEGGELEFTNHKFKVKPTPGMLIGFPSDHRFLHAALPTTSGTRYVIVSWAGVIGAPRVRPAPPYASVFVRQKRPS